MLLEAGDHILAGSDIYGGTYRLFHKIVNRAGISVTLADTQDLDALATQITPRTRLLWIESPGNPLMSLTDIAACAELARPASSLAGRRQHICHTRAHAPPGTGCRYRDAFGHQVPGRPQRPDWRGPGDRKTETCTSGCTSSKMPPAPSSHRSKRSSWREVSRRSICGSANTVALHMTIAQRLQTGLDAFDVCSIPACPNTPVISWPRRQMEGGFGGMLSFEIEGNYQQTKRLAESTRLFQLAVSLGAVESLIEQPASMSHASYDPADRKAHGIDDSLIRLSVGLEDVDDLWDDLQQAFARCRGHACRSTRHRHSK